jgi:von Willebrand factor type A domain
MQFSEKRLGTTNVELDSSKYAPLELLRINRLARNMRLTGQIISVFMDTLSIVQNGPAPAWTTLEGNHVSFAMDKMPLPDDKTDVAVWLGTFIHELCHSLKSPREDSELMIRLVEGDKLFLKGILQIHNIVEDQRAERLVLAQFSRAWRDYLVAALSYHLKMDSSNAWFLLCGRTWLSDQVRANARAAFVSERGEQNAKEVARLVGEYQRLIDPGENQSGIAWSILTELHQIFELDIPTGGCGQGPIKDGEPDTNDPTNDDSPPTADEADGDDQSNDGPAVDGEPCDDGKASDKNQGQGDKQGDSKDDAGDQSNDAGDDGENQSNRAGKGGKPPTTPFDPKDLKDQMRKDATDGLNNDPVAKSDIDSVMDAIDNGRGNTDDVDGEFPEGQYRNVSDSARQLASEIGDALLDFKNETEPGWIKGVNTGRLNVRRFLDPNKDVETMFNRYSPGQMDATELEIVVLLDVSGSMVDQMIRLSEAAWAIHQSVDDIDGRITMMTFSDGHRLMVKPGERPTDRMFRLRHWGGTSPQSALEIAYQHLANSQSKNRLLLALTDGDWDDDRIGFFGSNRNPQSSKSDQLIAAMRDEGITTALAYLPTEITSGLTVYKSTPKSHGCEHFQIINHPHDLARMFRDVALAKMDEWL